MSDREEMEKAIRVDERARAIADCHADWLLGRANLAAQVKALTTRGVGARVIDGDLVTYALVERDEVLALLGATMADGEVSA